MNLKLRSPMHLGHVYCQLTVLSILPKFKVLAKCNCESASEIVTAYRGLKLAAKSCKRCSAMRSRLANIKHGYSNTSEWRAWAYMRTRCLNSNTKTYKYYGGRGITICERWSSFEYFLADMGPKPSDKHSLDRINVDGNYEPSNCYWATAEQQANNKRISAIITAFGCTLTADQWARRLNISSSTIYARRKRGFSPERCLATHSLDRDSERELARYSHRPSPLHRAIPAAVAK